MQTKRHWDTIFHSSDGQGWKKTHDTQNYAGKALGKPASTYVVDGSIN